MKKKLQYFVLLPVLLAVIVAYCIVPSSAHALSPSDIKLRYDMGKRLLEVTINHHATQDRSNYIKFVEIKKNGTVVSIHTYKTSPDSNLFADSYRINAIEEDTLQVVVTFNHGGIVTSSMLIVAP